MTMTRIGLAAAMGVLTMAIGGPRASAQEVGETISLARALELVLELFDLLLHCPHALHQVENHVPPGDVDAEFVDQPADHQQTVDVVLAVQALAAGAAGGDQQALAFVRAEGLLMHADELRRDANRVDGLVGHQSWPSRSRSC